MPGVTPEEDDGLTLPEVGDWAERKYQLISHYAEMFATSMREKWEMRAYVDLFAAAGRARLRDSRRIVKTSAVLALAVRHPFDRYVFCEADSSLASALEERVRRDFPAANAKVLKGDCNDLVGQILEEIPTRRSLTFCLADPWNLGALQFTTIERLASRPVDFLVLVASYMDAHRNQEVYVSADNRRVEEFLGLPAWRTEWDQRGRGGRPRGFGAFIVDQFGRRMQSLGYLYPGPGETVTVAGGRGTLYHLAFFSRHELGRKFWREARRLSAEQLELGW